MAISSVKSIIAKKHLANVETILSDCKTGLPDASVDIVLLYDIFHGLSDPGRILEELHRVLKQDGTLSFSDHHLKENEIVSGITKNGLFRLMRRNKSTYSFIKNKSRK